MTIHLMQNTDDGDIQGKKRAIPEARHQSVLANDPQDLGIQHRLYTMLLDGQGNSVVYPQIRDGAD